jgi:hypothetical protein
MKLITRKENLQALRLGVDPMEMHRRYYAQFVTTGVKNVILRSIDKTELLDSADEHFNDIALERWDALSPAIARTCDRNKLREAEEWTKPDSYPWSLCTAVCIAKEAARQIVEASK